MTLKEYRHIYDKVSLSKEADERIMQALTEGDTDSAVKQTLTEGIPDTAVEQKKQRRGGWIAGIARIAMMAAMIAIPILAVEMMRLSAVSPTEESAGRKGNDLIKNTQGGMEFGYPISEYLYDTEGSYDVEDYEGTGIISYDYPEYENADDLVDAADLVFSGTVEVSFERLLDIRTGMVTDSDTDGTPYTIFFISVDQVYKGSIDGMGISSIDTNIPISSDVKPKHWIEIRRLGWQTEHAGYNLRDMMKDAPEIRTGVKYLFLASTYDNSSCPELINLTQSVYSMEEDQKEGRDSDSKASNQGITLSDILEGVFERKVLDKKEYPNGVSIEGEAWSQKIDEESTDGVSIEKINGEPADEVTIQKIYDASETESEAKQKKHSEGQAGGIGYGGQAGTPSK